MFGRDDGRGRYLAKKRTQCCEYSTKTREIVNWSTHNDINDNLPQMMRMQIIFQ